MKKLMIIIDMFLVVALAMMAVAQGDTVQPYKGSTDECYQQCNVDVYKPCLAQGVSQEECVKKTESCAAQCPQQPIVMPAQTQPAEKKDYYAPAEPAKVSPEQVQVCQSECSQEYNQCQAGGAPPGAPDCVSMSKECVMKCGSPAKPVEQPEKPYVTPSPEKVPVASCVEQCHAGYDEKTCAQAGVSEDVCKQKIAMCASSCEKKPEMPMQPSCPMPVPKASCQIECTTIYYECSSKMQGLGMAGQKRAVSECYSAAGMCLDSCVQQKPLSEAKEEIKVDIKEEKGASAKSMLAVDCEVDCAKYDEACLQKGYDAASCKVVDQYCMQSCTSGNLGTAKSAEEEMLIEKPVGMWEKFVDWFFEK